MNNVVPIRRTPKVSAPQTVSAIVVAGSGGASATTTTFGIATALRLGTGADVTAVDSTTDGGNLLARSAVAAVAPARSIEGFGSPMAVTSSGMVVLGCAPHGQSTDPAIVDLLLAGRHTARIYDVGTAVRSARIAALIRSGATLVVVAPARAEPLSRLREALHWISSTYGPHALAGTVIVVSHLIPTSPVNLTPIRTALAPRVAGFVEVPFDAELSRPGVIDHRRLAPASLDAWTDVLDVLGELSSRRSSAVAARAGERA